jgi:hypothetical protein
MSTFVDNWGNQLSRATVTVHTETRSAQVTYPHPDGGKPFRVMVHQKPNPIGFHARLPGDCRPNTTPPTTGTGNNPPKPPKR